MNKTNEMDAAENLTFMAGQNAKSPLSTDTKRQLAQAYFKLYYGMSWLNWTDKKSSLGMAWQRALEQINAFASAKDAKNPAGQYIRKINAAHQKKWPITIMTHENSDKKLTGTDEQIAAWRANAQRQINSALGTISLIMAQHRVKEAPQVAQEQVATETRVNVQTVEQINVVERTVERIHVNDIYLDRVHEQDAAQMATARQAAAQPVQMAVAQPQTSAMDVARHNVATQRVANPIAQLAEQVVAMPATARAARPATTHSMAAVRRAVSTALANAIKSAKRNRMAKPAVAARQPAVQKPMVTKPEFVPMTARVAKTDMKVVQPTVAENAVAKSTRPARPAMPIALQIAAPQIKAAAMRTSRELPAAQRNMAIAPRAIEMPTNQMAKTTQTPKAAEFDKARQAVILKPIFMYQRQRQNQRAA